MDARMAREQLSGERRREEKRGIPPLPVGEGRGEGRGALAPILKPAHPIRVHRGAPKFPDQKIVGDHADGCADHRDELRQLREIDVVAILLLKLAPVEIIERGRQSFALIAPSRPCADRCHDDGRRSRRRAGRRTADRGVLCSHRRNGRTTPRSQRAASA